MNVAVTGLIVQRLSRRTRLGINMNMWEKNYEIFTNVYRIFSDEYALLFSRQWK